MKKYINTAFYYAIAAMVGGVFYREFTKLNGFAGKTTLSVVHTHLFILGMFMFLIVAALSQNFDFEKNKKFRIFYTIYNIGVPVTVIMLGVRGVLQVLSVPLTSGTSAAISGIAGIGHIITGIGIIYLFLSLKEMLKKL